MEEQEAAGFSFMMKIIFNHEVFTDCFAILSHKDLLYIVIPYDKLNIENCIR